MVHATSLAACPNNNIEASKKDSSKFELGEEAKWEK
jgi:hypothetical protein